MSVSGPEARSGAGKRDTCRWLAGFFCLVLIASCSTVPPTPDEISVREGLYRERLTALAALTSWSLEGRLAVSNGKDGGSGSFRWNEAPQYSRMEFHGALGRGAWRLTSDARGAQLELSDGRSYSAPTVDELARRQLGWEVPVAYLSWWARGLAAPGGTEVLELDEKGRPTLLVQAGWSVEYGRYQMVDGQDLPARLSARRDSARVKLAIREWKLGVTDGTAAP